MGEGAVHAYLQTRGVPVRHNPPPMRCLRRNNADCESSSRSSAVILALLGCLMMHHVGLRS